MIRSKLAHDFVLAPNIEPRRNNRAVDILLLHYTGMATASAARDQLCNPNSGVSCHYLVDEAGCVTQMVGEEMRAWHAGRSCWKCETDTNSRSIGIEIHNPGHWIDYQDFPMVQIESVIALCRDILSRHDIPPTHILAHSDVAPGRKFDPGEKFDWRRLHEQGIGHWAAPAPLDETPLHSQDIAELQRRLLAYGYCLEASGVEDEQTAKVVDAFQRHFRPTLVNGRADRSTLETLRRLG